MKPSRPLPAAESPDAPTSGGTPSAAASPEERGLDAWTTDEKFRLLVEGVKDYAIFLLDRTGHVSSWNAGAERIKGWRAEEIIGQHFSIFYPEPVRASRWPERELQIATAEGRFEEEGWRLRKDGTRFWANVVITALFSPEGRLRGFAKVTRDLTERRQIEMLEETRRRMDRFLAMLAHELRNPLAPIANATAVLRASEDTDPRRRWATEVIERQAAHLTRLVDDLLDVSRITSGKITIRREHVRLDAPVRLAVEMARPMMERRRQRLLVRMDEQPIEVEGDAARLAQIVSNLLNNASVYSPPETTVTLEVERLPAEARITVRDEGEGFEADQIERMFEPFVQGERSIDRSPGGLGLGLTLVRHLARMHGGRVDASSPGLGRGATFTITLPLAAAPI